MINSHKLGLAFGGFAIFVHIVWIFLVAVGWAGPILAFVYRIHFVDISFAIADFSFGNALILLAFTAVIGYIIGNILGAIWNFTCKEYTEEYVVDKGY